MLCIPIFCILLASFPGYLHVLLKSYSKESAQERRAPLTRYFLSKTHTGVKPGSEA